MISSGYAMKKTLSIALFLAAFPAFAQNSAGVSGSDLGKQLMDGFQQPTHDDKGGKGAGTFTVGGVTIDTTEMAPGATRESMKNVARPTKNAAELEQQGMDAFDASARSEGVGGEAARTMLQSKPMTTAEVMKDGTSQFSMVENHYLTSDPMGELFKDCKSETTTKPGLITTTETKEFTCTSGSASTECGRARQVEIEFGEPAEPGLPRPVSKIKEQISFNGTCESDAAENQCRVSWVCADSQPKTIDGVVVDESVAKQYGLAPLFPGAPAFCWKAVAKVECPVCIEDEATGSKTNCSYVDIAQPEGTSCTAMESDKTCRVVGTQCLLQDEAGNCTVSSKRYQCTKQVTVNSNQVQSVNSCSGGIQCADGSCTTGAGVESEQGASMQVAMAQMAVADTLASDVTRDSQTIKESQGSANLQAPANDDGTDGLNVVKDWGYDTTDRGSADAEPEYELSEADKQKIAEAQLFKGNPYSCQTSFGGLVNCCKATDGGAKKLFWEVQQEVNRKNQAARMMAKGGAGQSGYQMMQNGGAGLSTLSNPFTSMRDNITGGGSGGDYTETTQTTWQQFMARARAEIKPALSPKWACSDNEFDLAVQREIGACSYAGTYCSKKVLGTCLKRREAYCCFKSPMSKMLRASAEPGGVLNHGNAKRPDCSGIPLDQIDRINWDQMDFNQLAANMDEGGVFEKTNDGTQTANNLTGAGATGATADRKNVQDRTSERLGSIDTDAVFENIAADAAAQRTQVDGIVSASPAKLAFSSGYRLIKAGQATGVGVSRTGSQGGASARVTVVGGSPELAGFYSQDLVWDAGDTSTKTVRVAPPAGGIGRVILELQVTQGSLGGTSQMTVEIN